MDFRRKYRHGGNNFSKINFRPDKKRRMARGMVNFYENIPEPKAKVILACGFGTLISMKSQYKPKPMVEIGSML